MLRFTIVEMQSIYLRELRIKRVVKEKERKTWKS